MARAAVGEGSWLAVDPWEVTRKRIMDYMSVLEHAKEVCHETFPGHAGDITILYMCQASQVRHLLKQGKSVEGMVGKAVARYIRDNTIAERVSGRQKWTVEDNNFMFDQEDKEDRPYHNLPRFLVKEGIPVM
eukprot:g17267.t2